MLKQCASMICIAGLAACVSNQPPPAAAAPAPAPVSHPTLRSGIELQYVEASVRPQDDVYHYLNGKWLRDYQLPADKGAVGSFTVLQDKTEEQLRTSSTRSIRRPAARIRMRKSLRISTPATWTRSGCRRWA